MKQVIAVILGSALISLVLCSEKASTDDNDEDGIKLEAHHSVDEELNEHFKEDPIGIVENLLVKVFVVIDYSLYQRWLKFVNMDIHQAIANIHYFYAHIVNGISKKYESIDTGSFRYKVSLSGYFIAQTLDNSMFTESEDVKTSDPAVLNFTKALKKLKEWVETKADVIKDYGAVAAFTTYEDRRGQGLSYIGSACTGHGVSVIQSGMFYSTIDLAAHEIGHTLGSEHDGPSKDGLSIDCDPEQFFLMTPKFLPVDINNYDTFSRCSRDYFEKYITSLSGTVKEKCFKVETTPMDEEVKKYLAELPGQRYTPDQYCQIAIGLNSFYCPTRSQLYVKNCQEYRCFYPNLDGCKLVPDERALDNMSCGNKSWCLNKQCVQDEKTPFVEDCNGDESPDCPRYMEQYGPNICKTNAEIKAQCCKTCSSV